MSNITEKQKRFIQEYLVDCNGAQAAIRAGFSAKNARQQASDLLTKPYIKEAIREEQIKLEKKLEISAERVRNELAKIAFSNIFDLIDIDGRIRHGVTNFQLGALGKYKFNQTEINGKISTSFEVALLDKLKALELLARMMGYFEIGSKEDDRDTGVILLPTLRLEAADEDNN